jgi:two-component system, LytTR family, response regulator
VRSLVLDNSQFPANPVFGDADDAPIDAMLRVLIIEDDPLAGDLLVALLAVHKGVSVVGRVSRFDEARDRLAEPDYDLVFLDIQLFNCNGFDLVPHVGRQARIVFVTGFEQHALRAFEVNALDYIVKPIKASRLAAALAKAHDIRRPPQELPRLQRDDQVFLRGTTSGGRFVDLKEIALVRSSENYSEVVLTSGDLMFVRRTMQAWENILPVETFVRVHRTAIVNFDCIERVVRDTDETTQLWLRGAAKAVPVSRRQWNEIRTRLADVARLPIQRH